MRAGSLTLLLGNVLYGTGRPKTDAWPAGNKRSGSLAAVGFVNAGTGVGGDYRLAASSGFKRKAANNTDPGADIDLVNAATAGVE